MRKLLIIFFLLLPTLAGATNYHFATAGDDVTGDGSIATPYQTITKLNALWAAGTLAPGDSVVFKAGDTFYGTITVSESGTVGSPIIIGKYWTGADPIISGFTTLASWINEGGGIYSKTVTSAALTNMVLVDGVQIAMGRYPDAGSYLTYNAYTSTTITDAGIGDATDWAGAEIVLAPKIWELDRYTITDHTGDVFTLSGGSSITITGNYFIQKDLRTLTATNEWFHSTSAGKLYIYGDPATKTVKMATVNNVIYSNGYDYITLDNLDIQGSITHAVYLLTNTVGWTIQNCSISFAGESGITLAGSSNTINANTISYTNEQGVYETGGTNTITNNDISYVGMIRGQAVDGNSSRGIHITNANCVVEYNIIQYTAYDGIGSSSTASPATIRYNFINYPMQILDDGGGIYTTGASASTRTISYNIILNSGVGNSSATICEGIYLDESTSNASVTYNTVAHCQYSGIKVHKGSSNTIQYNISYDNQIGIYFQEYTAGTIVSNVIDHNIFVAKASTGYALFFATEDVDVNNAGTIDYNIYARPVDDDYTFHTRIIKGVHIYRTLPQWVSYTTYDDNSTQSPIAVADTTEIDFYYNYTAAPVVQPVTNMIDLAGTKYAASYTIPAYYSVVLLEDPDPVVAPPDPPSVTTSAMTRLPSMRASGGGNCTSDGGGTLTAVGICWNTTGSPTTADSKTNDATAEGAFTSTMTGLAPNTTYYIRAYADNGIISYGYEETYTIGKFGTSGGKVITSGGKIVNIH